MSAVDKVMEHIRNANGKWFPLEELPFEMVHEDLSYDYAKYGTICQFIFEVPIIENTQTPRKEYVQILAYLHHDDGLEDASEWSVSAVEKHVRTTIVWE